MQNEIIAQGLSLMALGMGVVFVFLAILVVTTYGMSTFIGKYFPEAAPEPTPIPEPSSSSSSGLPDAKTIAILQQAINQHRKA